MVTEKSMIRKDKVLAAMVRTFFKYFALGIIEGKAATGGMELYEPRNVKQALLEHYADVSVVFNTEAFYAIMRMNYAEEELDSQLAAFAAKGDTSPMSLVRFACRSEEFFSCMVSEYKRNFELLLRGQLPTPATAGDGYAQCPSLGSIDAGLAESIINRIANQAYSEAKKLAGA